MTRRLPLVIFLLALAVRLAHLAELSSNPFFHHPVIDAAEYDDWARAIRAGDLLSRSKGSFWQAPLYPYFLAAVYFLAGGSYFAARAAQSVMGAGSALLVFLIGRRVAGPGAAGTRMAALAGFGAALYWPFIFFDGELLPVVLVIFLDLLALFLLVDAAERDSPARWCAAGTALGLGVTARATALLEVPLVLIWLFTLRRRLGARRALAAAGAILAPVCLLTALVTWRNLAVGGEPALVASSGGLNFYIGNNADYDRTVAIRPGARWTALLLEGPHEPGTTELARSNYFTRRALSWLAGHPGAALRLYAEKFYLFWNHHEIRRNQDPYFFRRYSRFLGPPFLGFAAVGPLAVVGLFAARRPWDRMLLLHLLLLGQLVGVLAFFVCERYRLPAVPYLLIFAAGAAAWLVESGRKRRWRPLAAGLLLWGAALAFSLSNAYGTGRSSFAREYYELGLLAEEAGDWARAESCQRQAIAEDARDPDFRVHLAIAEMGEKRYADAEASLNDALGLMPGCGDAWYLLGGIRQERGDFAKAEDAYRKGMQLNPMGAKPEVHMRLGSVLFEEGRTDDARAEATAALAADPGYPEGHLLLALIAEREGRTGVALDEVRGVLRAHPDHRAARAMLERMTAAGSGAAGAR